MSKNWNFYFARVNDEPASLFVDLGLASEAPVRDFTDIAHVRLHMLQPRDDGLSGSEEFDALLAVEDALTAALHNSDETLYVGRNTSAGYRDFYYYTTANSDFEGKAATAMRAYPEYSFQTGRRSDPEWEVYWTFLYPSEEDQQRIANRDLLDTLISNGDNVAVPRQIDHFCIFPDPNRATAFRLAVQEQGFEVANIGEMESGGLYVEYHRVDRPDDMTETAITLFRLTREHDGDYDGWACAVQSSS
jgi:uncharacterized protein (TIGR01619 family)